MSKAPTRIQVSAGGVVFRRQASRTDVVLISVGEDERWQLPKGLVGADETPEATALREVREETGLDTRMIGPLDTIEYWYYGTTRRGTRIRFHKYVHYYLLRHVSGDTADHDAEVNEARWFEIHSAIDHLEFENEKKTVRQASELIRELP